MNLYFAFLCLLSDVAFSATLLGMKERHEARFFDWIALASLLLLMQQTVSLALNFKMWL